MIYWATLWYKKFSTTQRSIDMEYVVTGCFVKRPTESQMSLAERNNGWQKVDFHNTDTDEYVKTALWNSCVSPIFPTTRHDLKKLYPDFMTYDKDYITLKWGTLKAWRLTNPALKPLIEEYNQQGGTNMSAMAQRDTQRQKEIICEMIDVIGNPVYNDWSGEEMTVEEAKHYIMEYSE